MKLKENPTPYTGEVRTKVKLLNNSDANAAAEGKLPAEKVRVIIDVKSLLYLAGTTLNFVSGLMGHGFKFENPNVKSACGCGESVQF